MATEKIDKPEDFINSFSFHDVSLDGITIDFDSQTATLITPDMNWNYEGDQGYVKRPCRLIFGGTTAYFIDVVDLEGVRIGDISANIIDEFILVNINLNLGGGSSSWGRDRGSISFMFKTLEVDDM
ncbi:hypothetical protein [Mesorhizobium sp. INR15]|uniref:hypothetical protein n=1 Tax=Mesorhizobium sp. INR15 TaxID=2654248 RepID=UPI0018967B34|nr:hypothetical protein [Mesorhizobium sp. INR15]QPC94178.1 hypothetical protein GA829_28295 [Mesorhizobium sp. INR15]